MSFTLSRIGQRTEYRKTITAEDVADFAMLSGDTNPLHLDKNYAAKTRFEKPIAHGALTTSLVSAALAKFEGVVVLLEQSFKFHAPVYLGETLTAEAELVDYLKGGKYLVETWVRNGEDNVVVGGTATILIEDER